MNPSPAAITAIQSYVAALSGGWAGNTDAQVLAAANAPTIDNPVSATTIGKPYTFADLLAVLSDGSTAKLVALPSLPAILDAVNAGEMVVISRWVGLLIKGAVITSDEATAMTAIMADTETDPSWPTQISWAESNIGRLLDINDIAASRPET